MTAIHPDSSAAIAPYNGDPHQVLLRALDAKYDKLLTDEQFDAVVSSVQAIPAQTVEVRPVANSYVHDEPPSKLKLWLLQHQLLGAIAIAIALVISLVCAFGFFVGIAALVTAIQEHALAIGIGIVLVGFMAIVFWALRVQGLRARADLYMARQPTVIYQSRDE